MTFDDLGLSADVLKAVHEAGYADPTPIQQKAIPIALKGRDVLGIAQTGTGKTASFVLPMIENLAKGRARARMPRSLILEPTRELAAQVADAFEKYGKFHKLNMALLIGGVSFDEQLKKLDRGVDVLIATPGRLLDHFERGKLLLNSVQTMVVDEADRMLDMGFIPDIERIFKLVPFTRQTLFFSATMPPEIQRLTDAFLQNPERIEVARPSSIAENVTQAIFYTPPSDKEKREVLRHLVETEDVKNGIVFCNRKRDATIVFKSLVSHEFNAGLLHGDLDQHVRLQTLDAFRAGKIELLVASDVAARGLDIPDVSHVFNFDVPQNAEDYVHRIGRTGRAGRSGKAMMIATPADAKYVTAIESLTKSKIEITELEGLSIDPANYDEKPRRGGRGGRSDRERHGSRPTERERNNPRERERSSSDRQNTNDRERPNRRSPKDNEVVIGMGDHVPAFMQRPVRRNEEENPTEPASQT